MSEKPLIYCALDTNDLVHAIQLAKKIGPVTKGLKLGLEFFNAFGAEGLHTIMEACPEADIFVDLKYHDIPNTVAGAVNALCKSIHPGFLNVHAAGGEQMMRAAKEACPADTKMLAVTILTSLSYEELCKVGYKDDSVEARVRDMALLAQKSGLDGVVCSAHEIAMLREACGPDFTLMVPGIRPKGADIGDQKRVMGPKEALEAGASHLVIGRPITQADDPAAAAERILQQIN